MKYLVILLIVFQSNISFAKNKKNKVLSKGAQSFKSFECKQKTLPIDMKYSVTENEVDLEIQFQDDLSDFQLVNVRGIDGVTVSNFQTEVPRNKLKFSKDTYHIEYSKAVGLGYVVIEANASRDGKIQKQLMSIPIGTLSEAQKRERSKDIIDVKTPEGSNSKPGMSTTIKYHRMKI
jgi:hypothetical protein